MEKGAIMVGLAMLMALRQVPSNEFGSKTPSPWMGVHETLLKGTIVAAFCNAG